MVHDTIVPVSQLGLKHFQIYPVWTWADSDDESLVKPIQITDSKLAKEHSSLFAKADIAFSDNQVVLGYISIRNSDQFVFSLTIFIDSEEFELHQILHEDFAEELNRLEQYLKCDRLQILPISYRAILASDNIISGKIS